MSVRREPLAPALAPQPNPDARFSADARFVIFSRKIGSASKIVLFDLATRKEKVLTQSAASETSPSLSPDRSKYAFVSGSTITIANVDGADVPCAGGPAKACRPRRRRQPCLVACWRLHRLRARRRDRRREG